jgi:hypothetical protein
MTFDPQNDLERKLMIAATDPSAEWEVLFANFQFLKKAARIH